MFHLCYWHFQSTTQLDLIHRHMQIPISNTVCDSVLILWTWRSVHDLTRSYPMPYVVRTDLTKPVTVPRPLLSVNSVHLILSDTFYFGSINNRCACFYKENSLWTFFACFLVCRLGLCFWTSAATAFSESLSGRQPHQDVKVLWLFGNQLRPHLQGVLVVW